MKTIKQYIKDSAAAKGERDVGSQAYSDYVTDLTPGQGIKKKDAKKADSETKKTDALKIHRATRLDDASDPEITQANAQYKRAKENLRKQHIQNVADIRSNKIGEEVEDAYDYKAKKGAIAAPGSGSIAKAKKAKSSDVNKSIEQQMADARKEEVEWVELDPTDYQLEYEDEEVDEAVDTWHPDPEKDRKSTSMKHTAKAVAHHARKEKPPTFAAKKVTPAQIQDILAKQRARKAAAAAAQREEVEEDSSYSERISEPVPAGNLSGAKGTSKVEAKKNRKYRQVTPGQVRDYEKLTAHRMFQAYEDAPANHTGPAIANWDPLLGGNKAPKVYVRKRRKIDARTKDYRETVKRTQARRDATMARETEKKLNMFGVQSNPFKEETEMKTKKYLTTKEGSIESAVLKSLTTEAPLNPNQARPTLTLPKKYLASREGSLERVVTETMTERDVSGEMRFDIKRLTGPQFRIKYRMTKQQAMTPGGGITHKGGRATLRHRHEEVEEMDENGNHPPKKPYKLPRQLKDPKKEKMVGTKSGTKVVDRNDPRYAKHPEHESVEFDEKKEVDVKDTRRTVDAIRAYDRSKDASRDADWDTEHGKKGKGDKEKKYAKKERGEIDKDDPNWKHRKYHTGMHGESSHDSYDHATALYKDQWKDRKIADYDKEHDKDKRAKEMRADAEVDRKRMWAMTGDKWKHAKGASGEEKGKKSEVGNPDPKDAYKKEEMSPLMSATLKYIDKTAEKKSEIDEDKLSYKERQGLPKGDFALPGKGSGPEGKQGGSYPIPDASHARNALARVSQHGSEAEKAKVRAAVKKKFPDIKMAEEVMASLMAVNLDELTITRKGEAALKKGDHQLAITAKGKAALEKDKKNQNKDPVGKQHEEVEIDEIHSSKDRSHLDKAVADFTKKGGEVKKLKPGRLKGMSKAHKAIHKARESQK